MKNFRRLAVIGAAILAPSMAPAAVIGTDGAVFNFDAVSDKYSFVYGGPSLTSPNGIVGFVDSTPIAFQVSKQSATLAAGDTISASGQKLALQGGFSLDVTSLNLTLTSASATLQGTTLRTAAGTSLDGAVVHGVKGLMAYTFRDATNTAIYQGKFVFREEDSNLTMGIATEFDGVFTVFLCGASGNPFITLPNASEAVLTVLAPDSPIDRIVQAEINGLEIELAFGGLAVPEPGTVSLVGGGLIALGLAARRRANPPAKAR